MFKLNPGSLECIKRIESSQHKHLKRLNEIKTTTSNRIDNSKPFTHKHRTLSSPELYHKIDRQNTKIISKIIGIVSKSRVKPSQSLSLLSRQTGPPTLNYN